MEETINKNPNLAKDFPSLRQDVKNSKLIETKDSYKKRKDHPDGFHTLESQKSQYKIIKDNQGQRYYISIYKEGDNGGVLSNKRGPVLSPTNSIAQPAQNLNPMQDLADKFKNLFFKNK